MNATMGWLNEQLPMTDQSSFAGKPAPARKRSHGGSMRGVLAAQTEAPSRYSGARGWTLRRPSANCSAMRKARFLGSLQAGSNPGGPSWHAVHSRDLRPGDGASIPLASAARSARSGVEPLGGNERHPIDVRLIAASRFPLARNSGLRYPRNSTISFDRTALRFPHCGLAPGILRNSWNFSAEGIRAELLRGLEWEPERSHFAELSMARQPE